MRALLTAVERSYAAIGHGNLDHWLEETVEALSPVLGTGRGTFGYHYDAAGAPASWRITRPIVVDGPAKLADAITSTFAAVPEPMLAALYRAEQRATTASALQGFTFDQIPIESAARFSRELGVIDLVSLHAGDPGGRGSIFGTGSARRRTLRPAEQWRFARLAAHLAAARRLVGALEPVATLSADAKLLDAKPAARADATQLRVAVRAMDKARGALGRTDPDEALSHWKALVAGRYSLVDRFESDGKRFIVAHENPPHAHDPRGLTGRERAVASLLALALPDKLIAYELGLSAGTVRAHVHAVLAKLGVKKRAEAIALLTPPEVARSLSLGPGGASVVVLSSEEPKPRFETLSPAERAVAKLAARGASTDAIAKKLGKSTGTVRKQLASAFSKLGVGSRAELARLTD